MKKVNKILALGILSVVFFAACKKTDNGPLLTPKEKTLTSKVWKLQSLTVPKSNDATKDSSITLLCSDSTVIAFDIYKAYQIADLSKGGCDSTIVPYAKGTWSLSANSDSLILKGKRNFVWKIEKLDDTNVKATFRDSISPTQIWIKTITLK